MPKVVDLRLARFFSYPIFCIVDSQKYTLLPGLLLKYSIYFIEIFSLSIVFIEFQGNIQTMNNHAPLSSVAETVDQSQDASDRGR